MHTKKYIYEMEKLCTCLPSPPPTSLLFSSLLFSSLLFSSALPYPTLPCYSLFLLSQEMRKLSFLALLAHEVVLALTPTTRSSLYILYIYVYVHVYVYTQCTYVCVYVCFSVHILPWGYVAQLETCQQIIPRWEILSSFDYYHKSWFPTTFFKKAAGANFICKVPRYEMPKAQHESSAFLVI